MSGANLHFLATGQLTCGKFRILSVKVPALFWMFKSSDFSFFFYCSAGAEVGRSCWTGGKSFPTFPRIIWSASCRSSARANFQTRRWSLRVVGGPRWILPRIYLFQNRRERKEELIFVCIRRCGNVWMDSIKSGDEETWRSRLVHSSTTNKKCGWTWFNVHSSARRGRIKWKGGDENR